MPQTAFQTYDLAHLSGQMSVTVLDPNDPGTPTNIIETDDAFAIRVDWTITGLAAPFLGGQWRVNAYLHDRDGVAPSTGLLSNATVAVGPSNGLQTRNYSTTLNVAAGRVKAGLYDLTVAITYDNFGPPMSIAAFSEGPILQFYNKVDQP
jgi:hypothetical protein